MKTEIEINSNKFVIEYYNRSARITNEEGKAFFIQVTYPAVFTDDKEMLLNFLNGDHKIFKTDIKEKGQGFFHNKWCYEDADLSQEALELEFSSDSRAEKEAEKEEERAKNTALTLLKQLREALTSLNIKFREVKYNCEYHNSHWEVRVGRTTVATVGKESYSSNSPRKWYWVLKNQMDVQDAIQIAIEAQKELQKK